MFESITESLNAVFNRLRGRGKLTEANIQEGLKEVRMALLEADVNYRVVKDFVERVTAKAVGREVIESVNPAQQIVKIVHDELIALMGEPSTGLPFRSDGLTVILMAGLQGSGKTTTCAKLAKLVVRRGHRPLLVAADIQRPAAIEQLKTLGKQIDVPVYAEEGGRPPKICQRSLDFALQHNLDTVILDTAGRLHIDQALMDEVRDIAAKTKPSQVYLVSDAMTGQDAVNSAKAFHEQLALDGVILTKLDGDARGGAALSIRAVTGKPIKFIGIGEKLEALEEFHPERMASRILGMGDIISLVEKAQEHVDAKQAEKLREKLLKTKEFDLQDFLDQYQQMKKMGPLKDLLKMIPGLGGAMGGLDGVDEKEFKHLEAIILSMTPQERRNPDLLNGSRRLRIAKGSGTKIQEVNDLLRQFRDMQRMMKDMNKKGNPLGAMLRGRKPGR
ncbi:MAG: signal recognition particle protein [Planctomycetes bacterium]|nr:signal recognition particle protein [Planctomycetota bacterium]